MLAHLLAVAYGLGAALITIGTFYVAGLLVLPLRWHALLRWPDNVVLGLTLYVLLCWVATTSRNIAVMYVVVLFGAILWALAALRFAWVQSTLSVASRNLELRAWLVAFSILYVTCYVLIPPPAGAALLTLPPDGALDLVTYARYAKHLLSFGTTTIDLASFEYFRSPAAAHLLAWHSLVYLGDPLDAAVPLIFMVAALFGTIALDLVDSTLGLSWRAGITIAAIAVCAPMFRWIVGTYSLGELLAATTVLYLIGALGRAANARSISAPHVLAIACGVILLCFSSWMTLRSPGTVVRTLADAVRQFSFLAMLGLPSRIPQPGTVPESLSSAALVMLPLVVLVWAVAARSLRRYASFDRIMPSPVDRRLAGALIVYFTAAVIVGNAAVHAVEGPTGVRWPGTWRRLQQVSRMPFRALMLRVADEPNGLSTALTMYYIPGRKMDVVGSEVPLDELTFDNVSRQQPLFIQSLRCEAVGHGDVVSVEGVGCLLLAPPSLTIDTSYPFNRNFLSLQFDRMTSRDPGGRWNTQSVLNLRLTADPQRVQLDRAMYVNFLVNPFLPAGGKPERLLLRWGNGRQGEVLVEDRQWFSLAVESGDWRGNRLWTVPVTIEFPEGRTILFQEVALTQSPRGFVAQIGLPRR
jgi:hypothetical protein